MRLGTLDVGACGCMSAEGMGMKANSATTLERAELCTTAGPRDEGRVLRASIVETWRVRGPARECGIVSYTQWGRCGSSRMCALDVVLNKATPQYDAC